MKTNVPPPLVDNTYFRLMTLQSTGDFFEQIRKASGLRDDWAIVSASVNVSHSPSVIHAASTPSGVFVHTAPAEVTVDLSLRVSAEVFARIADDLQETAHRAVDEEKEAAEISEIAKKLRASWSLTPVERSAA